jgi:hypothetical protein
MNQTIDLTGLQDNDVRFVQELVASLRKKPESKLKPEPKTPSPEFKLIQWPGTAIGTLSRTESSNL